MKSQEELKLILDEAKRKVQIGDRYFHYKMPEKTYIIKDIALLESSEEPCITYQAEYGEFLSWVRTLSNFLEEVETQSGKHQRFTRVI